MKCSSTTNRQSIDGFSGSETPKRIREMEMWAPSVMWRAFSNIRINYTHIHREWSWEIAESSEKKSTEEIYISPWGMVNTLSSILSHPRCYNSVNVLPEKVKEDLGITVDNFNKTLIAIKVANEGLKGYSDFDFIYCKDCKRKILPDLLSQYKDKLPDSPKIENLLEEWDKLKISNTFIDVCGCILPKEAHVKATPNGRRFIVRPAEHANTNHLPKEGEPKKKKKVTASSTSKQTSIQFTPDGTLSAIKPTVTHTSQNKTTTSTVKYSKKLKMARIDTLLDSSMSITEKADGAVDEWSKDFCIKTILTEANKMVSQNSSIAFYDVVADGVVDYHKTVFNGVEINGKSVQPPRKIKLNAHNISSIQQATLQAFEESKSDNNPFVALQEYYGKYYSLMHDGIMKFSMELNGVFLRTLLSKDDEVSIQNVPWGLTKIQGGSLNSVKLVHHVFNIINSVHPLNESEKASSCFRKSLTDERGVDVGELPNLPDYFECCKIDEIDWEAGKVSLVFEHWPVAIMDDGCRVNIATGNILTGRYGLLSPTARCSVHAGDGSLKRMATSETMCVEEVQVFAGSIRVLLRHFQLSGKSSELLRETLSNLELKELHMVTWCPTRISYLLSASK